jgi:hypothetical protein
MKSDFSKMDHLTRINYEEFYLLGYNAVYFVGSQPTFRRNMSPPSTGSKNKPSKKPELKAGGKQKTELFITTAVRTSNPIRIN